MSDFFKSYPRYAAADETLLIKGKIYDSLTHGAVKYIGVDNYMGQETHHFRGKHGDSYWLECVLKNHIKASDFLDRD